MIVIFEGPDGGGKDTIRREFERNNDYEHICVVRMFFSDIVYADYFQRPMFTDVKKYNAFAESVKKFMREHDVLIVYATAQKKVIYKRIKDRGERLEKQPKLDKIEGLYDLYFRQFIPEGRLCKVDTTNTTPEEVLSLIEKQIAEITKQETRK